MAFTLFKFQPLLGIPGMDLKNEVEGRKKQRNRT